MGTSIGGRRVAGFALGDEGCASNPPPPPGYVVWRGSVPPELVQWSIALLSDVRAFPYGQQWTTNSAGSPVVARKDHHTWTYRRRPDGTAKLETGLCIPGITLYRPAVAAAASGVGAGAPPSLDQPDPSLAVFSVSPTKPPERTNWFLVGASAGAAATVVGLFAWGLLAFPDPAHRGRRA